MRCGNGYASLFDCDFRVAWRRFEFLASQRRNFARQTEMTQQIATVWCDLDVENRVRGKKITDRRANLRIRRQNQQARRIFAEAELDWAAKHSFRFDAAQFAFSNLTSVRQLCPRQRERNFVANFVVGRTANNLAFGGAAVIDFANSQTISIRMARRRGDLRNDYVVDLRAVRLDVFGLNP